MRSLRTAVTALLALVLFVHFAITLAFTLPLTPLTVRYYPLIAAYIYPYFSQNWSFFAPDPPTQDDYVIAQYRYRDRNGRVQVTSWVNLSRTLNEAVQRNRFTPLEVVQLTLSNASGDIARSGVFQHGRINPRLIRHFSDVTVQPVSLHTVERIAMGLFTLAAVDGTPIAVRVGLFHHRFPRFSHAAKPDTPLTRDSDVTLFPFLAFERVAPL